MSLKDTDYTQRMYKESLELHRNAGGKLEIISKIPIKTQDDLALIYSPGVAAPCLEIAKDPNAAYEYTSKNNMVAVISNGTAVLGLGNLGAMASKPVMEGKAALFKRFAGIDSIDIEVDTEDPERFIDVVEAIGRTFGGINLEDIKAPDCFIIEDTLKEKLDIPVFHDDQHGTAIIVAAGLINGLDITKKDIKKVKIVVNGAGSAGLACVELIKDLGVTSDNVILCDTSGVIYKGRTTGMNKWKEAHAVETQCRTLAEALVGADVFLGLSVKGAVTQDMVKKMAPNPLIFAMANPEPEITPADAKAARPDAIVATGRTDYPNQLNNVMGFPYVFRGALDVRAKTINQEMKIAAANAIAMLARENVPNEVSIAYSKKVLSYGPEYIIPKPFDPRLMQVVPVAVAKAAMKTGVARKTIDDIKEYQRHLSSMLNPAYNITSSMFERLKDNPKRVIFAEGDEEQTIRAAMQWKSKGYGTPVLIAYEDSLRDKMCKMGFKEDLEGVEIVNAALHPDTDKFTDQLYEKLRRKGYLHRDCARLVKRDRNAFGCMMLENGYADAMITGLTRSYFRAVEDILTVGNFQESETIFGLSIVATNNSTLFIADTTINESPTPQQLVNIAIKAADVARSLGHHPRVAFLSFSNFGNPMREKARHMREAVSLMDTMNLDFEYEGEMEANLALSPNQELYSFSRLTGPANILIMPNLHSANIVSNLLQELSGYTMVGPIMCGLPKPVQVLQMSATENDILNLAAVAATGLGLSDKKL